MITSYFPRANELTAGRNATISRVVVTGQGMDYLSIFNEHYSNTNGSLA
jgi:hypothetical protein